VICPPFQRALKRRGKMDRFECVDPPLASQQLAVEHQYVAEAQTGEPHEIYRCVYGHWHRSFR